jgi:beta-phosphoglucomutase
MITLYLDMDGVLWNTSKYHKKAYELAISEFFKEEIIIDYFLISGMSTFDGLRVLLNDKSLTDNDYSELKLRKQRLFLEMDINSFNMNWCLINFIIENAKVYNFILATSSSFLSSEKFLNLSGLNNKFCKILSSNSVLNAKPHPEIYIRAIEGFDINNSFVIEDSLSGVESARKAGISNILLLKEFSDNPHIRLTDNCKEFANSENLLKCLKDHFSS